MVSGFPAIERMMNQALELDPDYNAGAPYALVGVYHASKLPTQGGEPTKAKAILDQGMAAHGQEKLLLPYLYARFYAYPASCAWPGRAPSTWAFLNLGPMGYR